MDVFCIVMYNYIVMADAKGDDNQAIQARCEEFLKSFGKPSFILFGWQKDEAKQFGVVSAQHKMPLKVALKCLVWALQDLTKKL